MVHTSSRLPLCGQKVIDYNEVCWASSSSTTHYVLFVGTSAPMFCFICFDSALIPILKLKSKHLCKMFFVFENVLHERMSIHWKRTGTLESTLQTMSLEWCLVFFLFLFCTNYSSHFVYDYIHCNSDGYCPCVIIVIWLGKYFHFRPNILLSENNTMSIYCWCCNTVAVVYNYSVFCIRPYWLPVCMYYNVDIISVGYTGKLIILILLAKINEWTMWLVPTSSSSEEWIVFNWDRALSVYEISNGGTLLSGLFILNKNKKM